MTPNRLAGHELWWEGRVDVGYGYRNGLGRAHCSCGAWSPELPSTAKRKQWHREHKDAIRAAVSS
jgi:hypothetical protein